MCANQPGAVEPTHGVITATLILPPGGRGAVSFPSASKAIRSRATPTTTALPSTLVVDTQSLAFTTPSAAPDTTLITTTSTSVSSTETQPPAATDSSPSAVGEATPDGSQTSMTSFQKAGIAVGAIGSALIALGFFLLVRSCRRNKRHRHELLSERRSRGDPWGYQLEKGHDGSRPRGQVPWMPPRAMETGRGRSPSPAKAYNHSSWRPSAIGLAISPAYSKTSHKTPTPVLSRPPSKLLPARPILAADIPDEMSGRPGQYAAAAASADDDDVLISSDSDESPSPNYTRIASRPPVLPNPFAPYRGAGEFLGHKGHQVATTVPRESTMTEFEEDGMESLSASPRGQIWRPPSSAHHSATAPYYVADKNGNWVLGGSRTTAELEATSSWARGHKAVVSETVLPLMKPADARAAAAHGGASRPGLHRRSSSAPNNPPVAAAATAPRRPPRPSIRIVTEPLQKLPDWQQQQFVPRPLFSGAAGNPRDLPPAPQQRSESTDSGTNTTIITSSSSSSSEEARRSQTHSHPQQPQLRPLPQPLLQQVHLSPVAESPRSAVNGRSPVSYPKIPGPTTTRSTPPPRLPILYKTSASPMPLPRNEAVLRPSVTVPDAALLRTGSPPMRPTITTTITNTINNNPFSSSSSATRVQQPQLTTDFAAHHQDEDDQLPPSWAPGLPAHPHPQHRPPHTSSTLWLPPQARRAQYERQMETEPHHDHHYQQQLVATDDGPFVDPYYYHGYEEEEEVGGGGDAQQPLPEEPVPAAVASLPRPHDSFDQRETADPSSSNHAAHPRRESDRHYSHFPLFYLSGEVPLQAQIQQVPPTGIQTQQHFFEQPQSQSQSQSQLPLQMPQPPPASLLAKRLGPERAGNLSVSTDHNSARWKRQTRESVLLSPQVVTPPLRQSSQLPSTPTWLPKLTPTRRGADLYLNVQ